MNGHRSNFARHTSAAIMALIAGLAGLSLPIGNTAWAQTSGFKAADSHAVIVTGEKVSLRCGASDFHYKIGDAAKGAILKADGEDGPWTRVTLPAIIHAFVKAEQANLVGDSVELKDASKLWAPNATAAVRDPSARPGNRSAQAASSPMAAMAALAITVGTNGPGATLRASSSTTTTSSSRPKPEPP